MTATEAGAARGTAPARRATPHDLDGLARMLAAAFWDDPIQEWLFPDEKRRAARLTDAFRREARWFVDLGASFTTDDVSGAALWTPPHVRAIPLRAQLHMAVAYRSLLGSRMRSAMRFLASMERHRPREPHWYLAILGTDPQAQGRGVATRVLQPILQRCDEHGLGAYLESSKESNVPWYERQGFELTEALEHPGGPTLWLMWREPR